MNNTYMCLHDKNKTVRAPAHVKSGVIALFAVPDPRVRNAAAQSDEPNVTGLTGPWNSRGHVETMNCQAGALGRRGKTATHLCT